MYFNGTETEELCTKLDAELWRGMSTDSSLCRFQRDAKKNVVVKKAAAVGVPARESLKTGERNDSVSAVRAEELPKREESKLKEIANVKEEVESVPIVNVERVVNQVSALGEPLC